jgi:hypothetical protein
MDEQCDFCNSHDVVWRYRAHSFVIRTIMSVQGEVVNFPWGSEGDWAACEKCSTLIEAGKWGKLADHSLKTHPLYPILWESDRPIVRKAIIQLHTEFRARRIGNRMTNWVTS